MTVSYLPQHFHQHQQQQQQQLLLDYPVVVAVKIVFVVFDEVLLEVILEVEKDSQWLEQQ